MIFTPVTFTLRDGRSAILRSLLEKLRVETFRISTAGLRFGLLYEN